MLVDLKPAEIVEIGSTYHRRLRRMRRELRERVSRPDPSRLVTETFTRDMRHVVAILAKLDFALGRPSSLSTQHPLTCSHGCAIDEPCRLCDDPRHDDSAGL